MAGGLDPGAGICVRRERSTAIAAKSSSDSLPLKIFFHERRGSLFCESVSLASLAQAHQTPLYVYSASAIRAQVRAFETALAGVDHLTCYAVKASSNLALLKLVADAGCGFDIVSGGELYRVRKAGAGAAPIVYSGVGKSEREIAEALRAGVLQFNVESEAELRILDAVAARARRRARVALRVNPEVDARTHRYVATGLNTSKFGIPMRRARAAYALAQSLPHLEVVGVDCHIGSQLTMLAPLAEALARVRRLVVELRERGVNVRTVDVGGGLGIAYRTSDATPSLERYAEIIRQAFGDLGVRIILEPGRLFVGNAAVLLTRVLLTKQGAARRFCVVDAAMNDLLRPALYDAIHSIIPVIRSEKPTRRYDVVGPVCESADFLALGRDLPEPQPGDLLAIGGAGAYGFSMASNYNSRPRAAEVLVDGKRASLVRRRETYADLTRGE